MPMSLSRGAIVMLPSIARNQPGVPDERGHLALKQYGDKAIEQSAAPMNWMRRTITTARQHGAASPKR